MIISSIQPTNVNKNIEKSINDLKILKKNCRSPHGERQTLIRCQGNKDP